MASRKETKADGSAILALCATYNTESPPNEEQIVPFLQYFINFCAPCKLSNKSTH